MVALAAVLLGACSPGSDQDSGKGGGAGTMAASGSAGTGGGAAGTTGGGGSAAAGTSGVAGSSAAGTSGAAGGGAGGGAGSASAGSGGSGTGGGTTGSAGVGGTGGGGATGSGGTGGAAGGTTGGAGTTGTGGTGGAGGGSSFFTNWPDKKSPQEVARRLVQNYLARTLSLTTEMHYAEACTWYGALTSTKLIPDATLDMNLVKRFDPILTPAGAGAIPSRAHVDDRVFGIVPLEIYMHNMDAKALAMGKDLADKQWMTTTSDGITTEARYWIDDMFMITALQAQAYRATGEMKYIDRAALTMSSYLDRLQQTNGLFFHTMNSPQFWGRGNGWFAAGMTELLRSLPANHTRRARIMTGYTKMMTGLLQHQATTGMWKQLIDNTSAQNWAETSGTAMFTYAMVTGVKNGWLPAETYGPAARSAWLAMVDYLDNNANVKEVCAGTGEAATSGGGSASQPQMQIQYYLARPRNVGDFHGQAPYLWTASALMR